MLLRDFASDPIGHAYELRRNAERHSYPRLDPAHWQWLLTYDAWMIVVREKRMGAVQLKSSGIEKMLLGLPVRITMDDALETEPIRLVCDASFVAKKPSDGIGLPV